MIQITIVSDSYSHFNEAIKEYLGRLNNVIIKKIKPEKGTYKNFIIKKETEKILEVLKKEKWYNIYLDIKWDQFWTNELFDFIEKNIQINSKFNFIIGWAYWVNLDILNPYINKKISLSKMTLPHNLAFLVLLEQLYRIETIKKWSWYHH